MSFKTFSILIWFSIYDAFSGIQKVLKEDKIYIRTQPSCSSVISKMKEQVNGNGKLHVILNHEFYHFKRDTKQNQSFQKVKQMP